MSALDSEDDEALGEMAPEVAFVVPDDTNCSICDAEFLDSEDLEHHKRQVHAGNNKCQFCETSYTGLESYARHITHNHWNQLKCCRFCKKFFTDSHELCVHEKKHDRQKVFGCSQCSLCFPHSRELELHEKLSHDNEDDGVFLKCMTELISYLMLYPPAFLQISDGSNRVLECAVCSFTTFDVQTYVQHLNDEKCTAYVCDRCGKIFKEKFKLCNHIQRKKKCTDVKYYTYDTCPNCLEDFPKITMDTHKKTCKVIYRCKACDLVFDSIEKLSNHQARNHPVEIDLIKCIYCNREFLSNSVRDKHINKVHKPNFHQYKYECKMCPETYFKHPLNLFKHYFSKHKDFKPFTCRVCNIKFRIRKRFTIHIKLDHKSIGFVEFDDQYNVFFTDKKSENPFVPKCVIPNVDLKEDAVEPNTDDKQKNMTRKRKVDLVSTSDEEDESLLVLKKKFKKQKNKKYTKKSTTRKKRTTLTNQRQFTCSTCHKYCYTYQNYHNHIKLHTKHQDIDCIKCSRSFSNKEQLQKHMASDHATSKLIETLKTVLERKQDTKPSSEQNVSKDQNNSEFEKHLNKSERFARTIKRVKMDKAVTPATIVLSNDISAKKFIENFMPDISEAKEPKESVTVTQYNSPYYRTQTIKLQKFVPERIPTNIKLKMPEKFKEDNEPKVKVKVKVVQMPTNPPTFETDDYGDSCQDYEDYKNDSIPEVAQEVMLEGTEEPPRVLLPQKIVLPKLPDGYKNISIATLTPEAPFYKIIKIKKVKDQQQMIIDMSGKKEKKEDHQPSPENNEEEILGSGVKLVPANPLAHLLGGRQLEDVMQTNKYYKPAISNVKGLIAKALEKVDKIESQKKKK